MKPYYEEAGITIYHGDAREVLPMLSGDAVVTDPPYGLDKLVGGTSIQRNRNAYDSFEDTKEYVEDVVIPAFALALSRCNGRGLVTPGIRRMFLYPNPSVIGGFYQPAAVGMTSWGFCGYNPVLFYGKDPRGGKGSRNTMMTLTEGPSDDRHPCAKPISAMKWMVNFATLDGEVVIDPFCGSGTTLVAAKDLGRQAFGVDISEAYCEIAANRLRQSVFNFEEKSA